ncbi:PAS domain S-box protein [Arthrobacter sp. R4]|uniref:PAS domain S-box protein n=1 Tax=Arthrobacter sp. R4 TaxID=644417 RepID=UPI003ED91903
MTQQLEILPGLAQHFLVLLKNSPMPEAGHPGVRFLVRNSSSAGELPFPEVGDYTSLMQSLTYCILIHDAETKDILWANQAACDMLGFSLDELKPLKAPDMSSADPRFRRSIGRHWLQDAADHGMSRIEWMYKSKTGREFLTEAIAVRVDLRRRPVIMVQFRDIEKEELLKSDLQRTEGRLQAFLRHMAEGILVVDQDSVISYASVAGGEQLGTDADQLIGTKLLGLCSVQSKPVLQTALANPHPEGSPVSLRLEIARADGSTAWFGASCQYIALEHDLTGTLVLLHDISEQVEAEKQHRRDLEHLNYLGRYNAMGDMAMAIAHELGQPLAAATNFIDGVTRRLGNPASSSADLEYGLDNAKKQINRANQIVSSLRAFVVQLEQSEQIVDLNDILEECLYFIMLRAQQHDTEIQVVKSDLPIWIRCEKVLTGQVILNLCHNAIDEMSGWPPKERHVTITTYATDVSGVFRVADRGKGLSHIPDGRIFDGAFTSKSTGSGIGLALSHRIITRQQGRLWAEENESRGASFAFELPLATAEDDWQGK